MQNRKRDHTNYEITSFVTPTFARHSWQLKTANPRLVNFDVFLTTILKIRPIHLQLIFLRFFEKSNRFRPEYRVI